MGDGMTSKQDPWRFQRWAFQTEVGNPVRKAVLSMLAMLADMTTGRCEAKQETLAQGAEVSERAVRNHLHALEEMGLIARRPQFRIDRGRRGDEYLLLAPGVDQWPDGQLVQPAPRSGGPTRSPGTKRPLPPERIGTPPGVPNVPGKNNRLGTTTRNRGSNEPLSSGEPLDGEINTQQVVGDLFEHWQQSCGHQTAKLTRDRRQKVTARLREGYTPKQIRAAIDGAARAAFVNDDGKRFDDLELICRSGSKLESFIERAASTNGGHGASNGRAPRLAHAGDLDRFNDSEW